MLKQIDKYSSIMTEKVIATEVIRSDGGNHESEYNWSVLFGLGIQKMEKGARIADITLGDVLGKQPRVWFKTKEDAQDYLNKIMNTDMDYNDCIKELDVVV